MKSITSYMYDQLDERVWVSCNGHYSAKDAETISKNWRLSLTKAYTILDNWDDEHDSRADWDNKKPLIFVDGESTYEYDTDDDEWVKK